MTSFNVVSGNLLRADVEALVNTVNTVGVMGKGLALQFKNAFPEHFRAYAEACKKGDVQLGKVFVFDNGMLVKPRWILALPTKAHWRAPSRLSNVSAGLDDLRSVIQDLAIKSIAVPPLGCGNGGLNWTDVRPLIEEKLDGLGINVQIYTPRGSAPKAEDMIIATPQPRLTTQSAALIHLVSSYSTFVFGVSSIEIQKLMYFLQSAGESLDLKYRAYIYGPYADNLRHVLQRLEGHFILGYGDGSRRVQEEELIRVLPHASQEAHDMLSQEHALLARIERVMDLVQGYESAYGLELLASVHWMATESDEYPSVDHVMAQVKSWTIRKDRMFTECHITMAWERLQTRGWLS